ncbi:MAG TPA: response regulator [Rhodospirillaceae bacterium]|nr:response regulator [Rhodospirillaceae bacterium]
MAYDWTRRRVLIVDRDDQFRFWTRGIFKRLSVRDAFSLANSEEAMGLLGKYHVDVALVELADDDLDGLLFIQALRNPARSPNPAIPVIVVLQSLQASRLQRALGIGIHGVLKKPFSGDAMLRLVAETIARPKLLGPLPAGPAAKKPDPALETQATAVPKTPTVLPSTGRPVLQHSETPAAGPAKTPLAVQTGKAGGLVSEAASGSGHRLGGGSVGTADSGAVGSSGMRGGGIETAEPTAKRSGDVGFEVASAIAVEAKPGDSGLETVIDEPVKAKKKLDFDFDEGAKVQRPVETSAASPKAKKKDPPPPPAPPAVTAKTPVISLDEHLAAHEIWVSSRGKEGKRAILHGADLSGRDLANAQLTSADLRQADLSGADLSGAQLHGADLREAELLGAKLSGANLAVGRFRRARLNGCSLEGANLKGADLAGADLSGAKFGDADLAGAILLGADLTGADLAAVVGLNSGQLDGAKGDPKTRLPFGLSLSEPEEAEPTRPRRPTVETQDKVS